MGTKPLQDKIYSLNIIVKELSESVVFVSKKHDKVSEEYSKVTRIDYLQKNHIKL